MNNFDFTIFRFRLRFILYDFMMNTKPHENPFICTRSMGIPHKHTHKIQAAVDPGFEFGGGNVVLKTLKLINKL